MSRFWRILRRWFDPARSAHLRHPDSDVEGCDLCWAEMYEEADHE